MSGKQIKCIIGNFHPVYRQLGNIKSFQKRRNQVKKKNNNFFDPIKQRHAKNFRYVSLTVTILLT